MSLFSIGRSYCCRTACFVVILAITLTNLLFSSSIFQEDGLSLIEAEPALETSSNSLQHRVMLDDDQSSVQQPVHISSNSHAEHHYWKLQSAMRKIQDVISQENSGHSAQANATLNETSTMVSDTGTPDDVPPQTIAIMIQLGTNSHLWSDMQMCAAHVAIAAREMKMELDLHISIITAEEKDKRTSRRRKMSTITEDQLRESLQPMLPLISNLVIQHTANQGADMGQFLEQLTHVVSTKKSHDFILKIHTKTDPVWRERMLESLCGTPEHVVSILKILQEEQNSLVAPLGTLFGPKSKLSQVFPHILTRYNLTTLEPVFATEHLKAVNSLRRTLQGKSASLFQRDDLLIAAGSSFWITQDALQPKMWADASSRITPKLTKGYVEDLGVEHAMERIIASLVASTGGILFEMQPAPRIFAMYFPQYHKVPENDRFWGENFTEWTILEPMKARSDPQLRKPLSVEEGGLGYYDLMSIETRRRQGELARAHGVQGFTYYHYWFSGENAPAHHKVMAETLEAMLLDGEPDLPFMLSWANEHWNRRWNGMNGKDMLLSQGYGNQTEWDEHFDYLLNFFIHPNYVRVNGEPVFVIYRIGHAKDDIFPCMIQRWRELAIAHGFPGLHIVQTIGNFYLKDRNTTTIARAASIDASFHFWPNMLSTFPDTDHLSAASSLADVPLDLEPDHVQYWGSTTGFDRRPRNKFTSRESLFIRSPEEFENSLLRSFDSLSTYSNRHVQTGLFFVTAWNEWNEQALLEPDHIYKTAYLHALKSAISNVPSHEIMASRLSTPAIPVVTAHDVLFDQFVRARNISSHQHHWKLGSALRKVEETISQESASHAQGARGNVLNGSSSSQPPSKIAIMIQLGTNSHLWSDMQMCAAHVAIAAREMKMELDVMVSMLPDEDDDSAGNSRQKSTITEDQLRESLQPMLPLISELVILHTAHQGGDMGQFLEQLTHVVSTKKSHDFILKIHTKTDPVWRERMLESLCGTPEHVVSILKILQEEQNSLVAPLGTLFGPKSKLSQVFPHILTRYNLTTLEPVFATEHLKAVNSLRRTLQGKSASLFQRDDLLIVAGSSFWITQDALQPKMWADASSRITPKLTKGYVEDLGVEHAMERIIASLVASTGGILFEMQPAPRIFAMYFPQYHKVPENDRFWGENFTEWTILKPMQARSDPQLRKPLSVEEGGLGYYDLMSIETRRRQGELARAHGVQGFTYYHYWFSGEEAPPRHKVMAETLEAMLLDGEPDLPFMLSWANEPWSRRWNGMDGSKVLLSQGYGNQTEWDEHFDYLLNFFIHPNYVRVNGEPVFVIYRIGHAKGDVFPRMIQRWRELAIAHGFPGLHIVQTIGNFYVKDKNTTAVTRAASIDASFHFWPNMLATFQDIERENAAASLADVSLDLEPDHVQYWGAMAGFDRRPRDPLSPADYLFIRTPEVFEKSLRASFGNLSTYSNRHVQTGLFFVTAWNEWNEQALLEPDHIYKSAYLHALRSAISNVPSHQIRGRTRSATPLRGPTRSATPLTISKQ